MKLPESMPDLLERANSPVLERLRTLPWFRRIPLKLQIGLPMGAIFGAYVSYRYRDLGHLGTKLIIGGGVALFVWFLAICVTVFDHFETKKRRANKRPPASFD